MKELYEILVCPKCKKKLTKDLKCEKCKKKYPVKDGIVVLMVK